MTQKPNARRLIICREFRDAAIAAEKANWEISITGGGHIKWKPPSGTPIFTQRTPSDYRGIKNALMKLKRAGLKF